MMYENYINYIRSHQKNSYTTYFYGIKYQEYFNHKKNYIDLR